MRKLILALSALSVAIPAAVTLPASKAEARRHYKRHYANNYYNGEGRRKVCRHSSGTTGLVAGGVGGALAGQGLLGHGILGTVAGAAGGAFAGRAVDRTISAKNRCYYR